MSDWTKETPKEPGNYWMRDSDGGPTLYECVSIDGKLRCGPKSARHRLEMDVPWSCTTEWKREI
jgi:hypothetical protein